MIMKPVLPLMALGLFGATGANANPMQYECTYVSAERANGPQKLKTSTFLVSLNRDGEGIVKDWYVDDLSICFYKTLETYDADQIVFSGCETMGMKGSLTLNLKANTFIQYSEINGEWLKLFGTCRKLTNS